MSLLGIVGAIDETLPSEVALVHAFVNTLDLRSFTYHGRQLTRRDHIATATTLTAWLTAHDLLDADTVVIDAEVRRALALRAALRASLNGSTESDVSGAVHSVRSWPLRVTLTSGLPTLAPQGSGIAAALGEIVVQVVGAVSTGLWPRLKTCAAQDCRWVFYDRSRPGRGRWCDPQLCGNRMKTRAYRTRRDPTAG